MKKIGVCLGRFSPVHYGHVANIRRMLDEFDEHLIIIGSASSPRTMRNPFTYKERKLFILKTFSNDNLRIVGIPDFWDKQKTWYDYLDDLLVTVAGDKKPVFIGGSGEDLSWFGKYETINTYRYREDALPHPTVPGKRKNVSSSLVRDILLVERGLDRSFSLASIIPLCIKDDVCKIFDSVREEIL